MASYKTIAKPGMGEFKDRGSKFLGYSYAIWSREDVDKHLAASRALHPEARHHCYGFVTGRKGENYYSSDDGEPSHSAGDPILGQIRRRELTGVLVIVVRYFGGTKLGVPGLIQAYKAAAEECLEQSGEMELEIRETVEITFPYASTSVIEQIIHGGEVLVESKQFEMDCTFILKIKEEDKDNWNQQLLELVEQKCLIKFNWK